MLSLAGLGGMRAIMLLSIIGYPAPSAMKVSQGGNQLRDKVATFHLIIWTCRWRIRTCSRGLGCLWHITRAHTSVTADMPWGPRLLSWFSRCIPMLSFVLYLQLGRPFVLLYSYISWEVNHLFFFSIMSCHHNTHTHSYLYIYIYICLQVSPPWWYQPWILSISSMISPVTATVTEVQRWCWSAVAWAIQPLCGNAGSTICRPSTEKNEDVEHFMGNHWINDKWEISGI